MRIYGFLQGQIKTDGFLGILLKCRPRLFTYLIGNAGDYSNTPWCLLHIIHKTYTYTITYILIMWRVAGFNDGDLPKGRICAVGPRINQLKDVCCCTLNIPGVID